MSLPRHFWYIWTALLLNRAGGFVVITLTLYLTTQRGLAESQAGVVVGMFGAGGAVGVLLTGPRREAAARQRAAVSVQPVEAA